MDIMDPAVTASEQLLPEEAERRLIDASERYMSGEMTIDEFEEVERRYMSDYHSALIALAKRRRLRRESRSVERFAREQAKRLIAY